MYKEKEIFIIGHKNPDTDSICSAIALADIKNRTSKESIYVPKRAGQINEETEYVLNKFNVIAPDYINDVGTQVKDMEIRETPPASKLISIKDAWTLMKESEAGTLPITDRDSHLEGVLTIEDIAESYMDVNDSYILSKANTSYSSIAKTIKGKIVSGNGEELFTKGKIVVGAAMPDRLEEILTPGDLVILGDRDDAQQRAVDLKAGCIIICVDGEMNENIRISSEKNNCVIITTSLDTYTTSRLVNQSIPIEYIMRKKRLIVLSTEDYTDDIKDVMTSTRHRSFPVIDNHKK